MKAKISSLLLFTIITVLMFTLAACGDDTPPETAPNPAPEAPADPAPIDEEEDEQPEEIEEEEVEEPTIYEDLDFPGIIAIVTNADDEEFRSAEALVQRFGAHRIMHRTWPADFIIEADTMAATLSEISSNPEVGAIIINQGVMHTNAAIDVVRRERGDDVFIAVANPQEDPREVYARVDLALEEMDELMLVAELVGLTTSLADLGISSSMANTEVAFMYAVEWLNESVSTEVGFVDVDVLTSLFADYIQRTIGARMYPEFMPLHQGGNIFSIIQIYLIPIEQ